MAIQRAIERVPFTDDRRVTVKIGIHAGEALIGQSADRVEIDADAKRALWNELDSLLARAGSGDILASAPVAQFLERRFNLAPRGTTGAGTELAYLVPGRERPGLAPKGHMIGANLFGAYTDQAFSALRIQDFKHFLRFRIRPGGALDIYAIGIDRVPRAADARARYRLIDGPIRITPSPPGP